MGPPSGYPLTRWRQIPVDGFALVDQWGEQLQALGWTTLDLFGVNPDAPWNGIHLAGLALLLNGDRIAAITETSARIATRSGAMQSFTRKPTSGAVPVWALSGGAK